MAAVRVLVVEDDADSNESLATVLRLTGFEPRAVMDGVSALRTVREFRPHAVILSIDLPGFNGFEVVGTLAGLPAADRPKIVVYTGYAEVEKQEAMARLGADLYLVKPAEPMDLIAFLRKECPC
jgi:two-component system, chemotaxis family, CheB/CheR fusion protein